MKKLLIALATVAMGVAANAASYTWKCSSAFFDGTGTTAKMTDSTSVYLMFASAYNQSTLVSDFASGSVAVDKAIATATISGGKFSESYATYETTSDQTAYLAVIYGDRLFISTTANAECMVVGDGAISFASQAYLTRYNNTANTLLPDHQASAGYAGAGWYSAAAIPEPTSGLLMLLGMAGLALKRKRA